MAPLMTNSSNLARLKDIKQVIRCLLISVASRDVTLKKLNTMYNEEEGEDIPHKEFNFTSLRDFLFSMPDVVRLEYNDKLQSYCAYHINTEKSKHISVLKEKEKKQPCEGKNKMRTRIIREHSNPVDPQILYQVLKDLYLSNKKKIKKEDILTEINKRIGNYSFYTLQGLNSQLSEFLHLIKYDNDYIYFKDRILENNSNLQTIKSKNQNRIINDNKASTKSAYLNSISDFINEKIQERLIKLIEKHPNGIWCSDLPKLYVKEFGFDLQYSSMGFNSVTEFVAALPHIFKIVIPSNTQKQIIVDARRDSNDLLHSTLLHSIPFDKSCENVQFDFPPHPSKLSPKVSKSLIPQNTMNIDETVDQITVSSLFLKPDSLVDIIVCEAHNPSFFWVMLHKNKKKFDKFMSELHNFYSQQDLNKYKVAKAVVQPGLNIACTFVDLWHRGIVTKVNHNGVYIHFYDYGTIYKYSFEEIYYLDKKFAVLPAQAIPCGLYNIEPVDSNKWPSEYSKKFLTRVLNKAFVATIFDIDKENNSMIINLIDTSPNTEVYINEWAVARKMAKWGKFICKRNNFTFEHYKECLKIKENFTNNVIEETQIQGKISFISVDVRINCSPSYSDSKKQLEALQKYKARLSGSLSSTSLSSMASSEDSASSISSTSSISLINRDDLFISEDDNIKEIDKSSDLSESSEEKADNPELLSKDLCSSQYSLSSTDSFISNTSSDKSSLLTSDFSKLMFKSSSESTACDGTYSSSNQRHRKNNKLTQEMVNPALLELQKLIANTKI